MKNLRPIVILIILAVPVLLKAQYSETISTDRPGQAIGTTGVGKSVVQVQTGLNTNWININDNYKSRTLLSNTVVRFGLLEWLELNGAFNWQDDKVEMGAESTNVSGVSSTEIGTRMNILGNKGAVPAIGFQASLLLKAQSADYKRDKLGSKFMVTTGNSINDWLSVATNLGITWDGNGNDPQSLYVLNFGFAITDKIGAIAEVYGSFNEFDANYDAGISYLVSNNVLLDLTAGWQGDSDVSNWFIDAGISFRLDWRK